MSRIVIAGGHGKIAIRLERLLASRGHTPVGLIRNADQAEDLRAAGAEPVVCDLEQTPFDEVVATLSESDAVVFAAGAGPGSGAERKTTVDRNGAILLADAAERAGVRRFLVVSAMNAGSAAPEGTDPVFAAYLKAKAEADADIRLRDGLDWTILRPGRLTDDPGSGRVALATDLERGEVPRDDVAEVLAALLDRPETARLTLDLVSGGTTVTAAVDALF